jgi:Cu/Ag efflux protein CusF
MSRVNTLQMSLFGNFINIKPQTNLVISLLTALQEEQFIPGAAEIANIDMKTGKITVDNRMQLMVPDRSWSIVFLGERIDFNYVYQNGAVTYSNPNKLIDYGRKIIEKTFSVFENTTGNRVAVNCSVIIDDLDENARKEFCNKYTKKLGIFENDSYTEWGVRFNSRGIVKIQDKEEKCNRIIDMQMIERPTTNEQSNGDLHDIVITMDINTAEVTPEKNFSYEDLLVFSNEASDIISKAFKELEV